MREDVPQDPSQPPAPSRADEKDNADSDTLYFEDTSDDEELTSTAVKSWN